jgi:hypothetical protein
LKIIIANTEKSTVFRASNIYIRVLRSVGLSFIKSSLLKVPKREIFVTELFTLSDPIWIGDLRTELKNPFV